jgi:hypothetical protein
MTIDYDYARTFFDIIMISPFCGLLLVPNVHIPVSLLSIFQRDTSGVTAHMAHFTGHINAFGQGSRSLVLRRDFLQVRITLETQRTRETDQSNVAYAAPARLNSNFIFTCVILALPCTSW